ncbi:MAG: aldo/keto reductase [Clostridium sp.]|uniref:aldo/keto reductase n=1 Tax=Clostridium sp. TaxID=1506 RepID=UPI00302622A9
MFKRNFKDTDLEISLLGLGCMRLPLVEGSTTDIDYIKAEEIVDYAYSNGINYFDTAYPYHGGQSEKFVGQALKKYPRGSFNLVTKLPIWIIKEEADLERIFNEQLANCQTDYFDFYLCHAIDAAKFKTIKDLNIYEFLCKKKAEGKIRYIGFSFHDVPSVLEEIADAYPWDFAQIQLNYLDWELYKSKEQYEILAEREIPCIIMEPVRGGALANPCEKSNEIFKAARPDMSIASWAIRYAATLPNVLTVLSGMSNMEQIQDNVATMSNFEPLTVEDYKVVDAALDAYKKNNTIPCTGCRYCMDCPIGVDIPEVFKIYNDYAISKYKGVFKKQYLSLPEMARAHNCISCGACMNQCPQSFDIPEKMKIIADFASSIIE